MRGEVYQIVNSKDNKVYIGSTTYGIAYRWKMHRRNANNDNAHLYQHMRDIGPRNFSIEFVTALVDCTRDELRRQESLELLKVDQCQRLNQRMPHAAFTGPQFYCSSCDCSVLSKHKSRHLRTKKHKFNLHQS